MIATGIRTRATVLVVFVLAGGAGAGIVVGRELRPSAHAPQPVRTSTARLPVVTPLSSLPALPVLSPRP